MSLPFQPSVKPEPPQYYYGNQPEVQMKVEQKKRPAWNAKTENEKLQTLMDRKKKKAEQGPWGLGSASNNQEFVKLFTARKSLGTAGVKKWQRLAQNPSDYVLTVRRKNGQQKRSPLEAKKMIAAWNKNYPQTPYSNLSEKEKMRALWFMYYKTPRGRASLERKYNIINQKLQGNMENAKPLTINELMQYKGDFDQ